MSITAEIRKNASEVIRVEPTTFNGQQVVDVRVWYHDVTGQLSPSRKGLTLRPETWRQLLPEVEKALDAVE